MSNQTIAITANSEQTIQISLRLPPLLPEFDPAPLPFTLALREELDSLGLAGWEGTTQFLRVHVIDKLLV